TLPPPPTRPPPSPSTPLFRSRRLLRPRPRPRLVPLLGRAARSVRRPLLRRPGSRAAAPPRRGGRVPPPVHRGRSAGEVCHRRGRSEEHTSELQSRGHLVCRLL